MAARTAAQARVVRPAASLTIHSRGRSSPWVACSVPPFRVGPGLYASVAEGGINVGYQSGGTIASDEPGRIVVTDAVRRFETVTS